MPKSATLYKSPSNASTLDSTEMLSDAVGRVEIVAQSARQRVVTAVTLDPEVFAPDSPQVTDYPIDLIRAIFKEFGSLYSCQEIGRDTDANDAALDVRYSVEAYCEDHYFARPMRILDYGCGAGSSTMTLVRLFTNSRFVGLDYMAGFLDIARQRASYYGVSSAVDFGQVDASGVSALQEHATFDAVFLNAVYEHLLPAERPVILAGIWRSLKPGGLLFLNQTPHRWFPIETHTTGLPLINYLPRSLAQAANRRFTKRVVKTYTWDELLRAGVRGSTVSEIMRNIRSVDPGAKRLEPICISSTWPGIWYAAKRHRMGRTAKLKPVIRAVESFVEMTGIPLTPYVNIAVQKSG